MMTTADPNVLGLVGTSSMEPFTVAVHTRRTARADDFDPPLRDHPKDQFTEHKVTFRAPAAYYSMLDLKEGPAGPTGVEFSVWNDSFEPYQPDYLRYLQMAHERRQKGSGSETNREWNTRVSPEKLRGTGEHRVSFIVTNAFRPAQRERQRALRISSEPKPDQPCDREFIAETGLRRLSVPDGVSPGESCVTAPALEPNRTHYQRTRSDGSLEFIVICRGGKDENGEFRLNVNCQLQGYFRHFPVLAQVRSNRPDLFVPTYEKIMSFLDLIAIEQP